MKDTDDWDKIIGIYSDNDDDEYKGVCYFFSVFNLYGQKEEDVSTAQQGIRSFVAKLTFWGSAIASLGILFSIAGFEGGETMLTLGMATLMFMLLAMIIMSLKPGMKMQFHVFTYARLLLIALTALLNFGTNPATEQISGLLG